MGPTGALGVQEEQEAPDSREDIEGVEVLLVGQKWGMVGGREGRTERQCTSPPTHNRAMSAACIGRLTGMLCSAGMDPIRSKM